MFNSFTSRIVGLITGISIMGTALLAFHATGFYLGSLLNENGSYTLAVFAIVIVPAFVMAFTAYGADAVTKQFRSWLQQSSSKGAN